MSRKNKKIVIVVLVLICLAVCSVSAFIWPLASSVASVEKLEEGLYKIDYKSDYGFDEFISKGGGETDLDVANFVVEKIFRGMINIDLQGTNFGCSTLSTVDENGDRLFGRNFDWGTCTALIVETKPKNGYASISTVNMDFLKMGLDMSEDNFVKLMSGAAPYAPMDGMNEKGLCTAVLMIQDDAPFSQDKNRPDLTTTTAVRLLLDKAANVEEALNMLSQYDLHASANMVVHFAISDNTGRSVVVEYIDNEMIITETPVVTNFYLAQGDKYGIGSEESRIRYEILTNQLKENKFMTMDQVKDGMSSVSKGNFNSDFASTQWSIVYNQTKGRVDFYHRENYDKAYSYVLG